MLLESLIRVVASQAKKISTEEDKPRPNRELIARWKKQGDEAMRINRTLNVRDREAVEKARKRLGALLAQN